MVDFDALEAAGLEDARDRADVIRYLDSLGFTADEIVEAGARGRLVGLAGDVLQSSGAAIYSMATGAEALGVPVEQVAQAWEMLGLIAASEDEIVLSQADVDALATWFEAEARLHKGGAFGFLRVLGTVMARLAEAELAVVRDAVPELHREHAHDDLAAAKAYRVASEFFVPRIESLFGVVHRQHLVSARTYFARVIRDESAKVACGVGFADLAGFTALTQTLTVRELWLMLNEFGAAVRDVVLADGGRVVKFIGDEVMWVSATPDALATAAVDLVNHPKAREASLMVRAGLGYGDALAFNGDYFGTVVNLASRLVDAASPGQILVSQKVRDKLPGWSTTACDPLMLKGFDAPVTAYELHGRR